jgi:hypothetical protein
LEAILFKRIFAIIPAVVLSLTGIVLAGSAPAQITILLPWSPACASEGTNIPSSRLIVVRLSNATCHFDAGVLASASPATFALRASLFGTTGTLPGFIVMTSGGARYSYPAPLSQMPAMLRATAAALTYSTVDVGTSKNLSNPDTIASSITSLIAQAKPTPAPAPRQSPTPTPCSPNGSGNGAGTGGNTVGSGATGVTGGTGGVASGSTGVTGGTGVIGSGNCGNATPVPAGAPKN